MALLTRTGAAVLLLLGQGAVTAAAQPDRQVGQVVEAAPMVNGRLGSGPPVVLKKQSAVFKDMEVETSAGAGARIAINRDLRQQQGTVILGPRTIVRLTQRVVNEALGLDEMSWLVKLGQFRLALFPPPPGAPLAEGEYTIVTSDQKGNRKTVIRLRGTDVAVNVDSNGSTTVWVLEGEVTVEAPGRGGPVQVPAGYRIRVPRRVRLERPVRFEQTAGTGPIPSYPHPGETIFPDPPRLDLRRLRLDLPR
jgi:hypothetical protein